MLEGGSKNKTRPFIIDKYHTNNNKHNQTLILILNKVKSLFVESGNAAALKKNSLTNSEQVENFLMMVGGIDGQVR